MRSCWSMRSFRPLKPITATGTNFSLLRARLRDILVAITRTRTATATQPRTSAQPRRVTHRHRHTDTRPHTYSHTHTHREPCNTRSTLVVQHARTRCRRHLGSHHQSGHHAVSHQTRPGLSSVRGPTPAATTRAVCCTCVGKGDRLVARRHTPTGPGYEAHRSMRGSRRLYSMCLNCLYCDRRLRSGMYTARSSWTSLMSWGEIIVAAAPAVAVAAPAVANGFAAAVVAVANGFAAAGAAAVAKGFADAGAGAAAVANGFAAVDVVVTAANGFAAVVVVVAAANGLLAAVLAAVANGLAAAGAAAVAKGLAAAGAAAVAAANGLLLAAAANGLAITHVGRCCGWKLLTPPTSQC